MDSLDMKDRRILFEIDSNARQSDSSIGKKTNLSKQVVGFRLRRLLSEKIISSFYTVVDISKLGYTANKNFIRLQNVDRETEETLLQYIKEHKDVVWAASCDGRFDIVISFWAKNMAHLNSLLAGFQKKFGDNILERQLATIIHGEYFIRDYLTDAKPSNFRTSYFGSVPDIAHIDRQDWQILLLLSKNARVSATGIASHMKMSSDAVADRIKRLEKEGVIKHYNFVPNESCYPYVHYKLLLDFRNLSNEREKVFMEYCRIDSNMVYIVKCLGPWDFEIDIEVESAEKFRQILMNFKTEFNDIIKDYSVLTLYKVHKYNFCPSIPKEIQ